MRDLTIFEEKKFWSFFLVRVPPLVKKSWIIILVQNKVFLRKQFLCIWFKMVSHDVNKYFLGHIVFKHLFKFYIWEKDYTERFRSKFNLLQNRMHIWNLKLTTKLVIKYWKKLQTNFLRDNFIKKTKNAKNKISRHLTSYDVIWRQMTSDDVRWRQMTSYDVMRTTWLVPL